MSDAYHDVLVEEWLEYYFNKYGRPELPKSTDGQGCDVSTFIESLSYTNKRATE